MPPRSLPILLHGENTTPEDGNLLGRVWGRATRSDREIKTLTQDGSRILACLFWKRKTRQDMQTVFKHLKESSEKGENKQVFMFAVRMTR